MIPGTFLAGLLPLRPLLGGNTSMHTETSHSQPGPRPIASSARVQAPPFAARPHRSFYCKTSGQGGPPSCTSSESKHEEKPPRKVTARILALIVRQSQLGRLGSNASPLRSYHAQQPNNMAKSLVGEECPSAGHSSPGLRHRGSRGALPGPSSSLLLLLQLPSPLPQPLPAKYQESFGERNQGFDS